MAAFPVNSMLCNFAFVLENQLAGCAHPGFGGMLRKNLEEMRRLGITAVVSLTESPLETALLEEYSLAYFHLPVEDFGVPTVGGVAAAFRFIRHEIERGGSVAVHCAAGYGRTGTLLACCLAAMGLPPADAIHAVREARPGSIETRAQEIFIEEWARWWDEKNKTGA